MVHAQTICTTRDLQTQTRDVAFGGPLVLTTQLLLRSQTNHFEESNSPIGCTLRVPIGRLEASRHSTRPLEPMAGFQST